MRVLLGFQDQCTFKLKPNMHTDLDFDVLYIDVKIMKRSFQRYHSYLQIRPESSEIYGTIQSPEIVSVL
jgi:hypothetical protein